MTVEIWILYVGTVLLLMSTPGPSQLLMMSVSMGNGFVRATATAAGDLTANALQILAAGLGLGALVLASETAFTAIQWGGVAYLIWMGVQKLRAAGRGHAAALRPQPLRKLWLQGFVTSAANPKAVVFFAALFPQFLDPAAPLALQIVILGATYIAIDAVFLSMYGGAAAWLARRLKGPAKRWLDRIAGGALILAAGLLALKSTREA